MLGLLLFLWLITVRWPIVTVRTVQIGANG